MIDILHLVLPDMMIHADTHEMEHETGIGNVSEIIVGIATVITTIETNEDKVDTVSGRQVQDLVGIILQTQETRKTE
jgi:hypothetical protein